MTSDPLVAACRPGGRMHLLVSVRDAGEALTAAVAGVDFIDLKDPARGALGGLAPRRIGTIVAALREAGHSPIVSATIGDLEDAPLDAVRARVHGVAARGPALVKVGIPPGVRGRALLQALPDWDRELATAGPAVLPGSRRARVVPVLLADDGPDPALLRELLDGPRWAAVMLDTAAKGSGSLLERVGRPPLARFVAAARARAIPCGLAGALRADEVPELKRLGADFAGFRSAVCTGHRAGPLDPVRLAALRAAFADTAVIEAG